MVSMAGAGISHSIVKRVRATVTTPTSTHPAARGSGVWMGGSPLFLGQGNSGIQISGLSKETVTIRSLKWEGCGA